MTVAWVTGASSGIGVAYAERLAADGWDLVLVARRGDRLDEVARRLGDQGVAVTALVADLADPEALDDLCERLAAEPPDLLVNNAGLAHYMPFTELPPERARELVDVNVTAPLLLERAALPGMVARGSGAVINVASLLAFSGPARGGVLPQRAVYAATKSFLVTHSQVLAAELEGTGVRVQVVCPGVVRSEFHSRQGMDFSAVPRMEPESIVTASLADLDRGVVVCVPALEDEETVREQERASVALMSVARTVELPPRYATAVEAAARQDG